MEEPLALDANMPVAEAVGLVKQHLAAEEFYQATCTVNFFTMQYRPESDHYRRAFVEAGVTPDIFKWVLTMSEEKQVYAGCRVVRALAGSPNSPDITAAVLEYVDVHLISHILTQLRKFAEFHLDTVEQIVGSIMNTLRTSVRLRSLFMHAGGLPALTCVLRNADVQKHPRVSLFCSYAILGLTRDIGNHEYFRQGSVLADIKTLLNHSDLQARAVCMMILANLAQSFDDPADDVSLDVQGVRFVVDTLQETLHPIPNKYYGWKIGELVHALFSISSADTFKGFLVDAHAIPILLEVLETEAQREHWKLAVQALHNLCFHSSTEEKARNSLALADPEVFKRLKELVHSEDTDVVRYIARLLKDLSELHDVHASFGARMSGPVSPAAKAGDKSFMSEDAEEEEKFDVMLSYAWASQRVVLAMRDKLTAAGLKVWIDVEYMGHNLIDSMATAVENSTVIVICCSSAYKASPNCRREADYAAHLRKPTVIANMEDGYVPRGWLGLHVAGKIWCDFRDETPSRFERGVSTLFRQLAELGVNAKNGTVVKRVDSLRSPSERSTGAGAMPSGKTTSPAPSPPSTSPSVEIKDPQSTPSVSNSPVLTTISATVRDAIPLPANSASVSPKLTATARLPARAPPIIAVPMSCPATPATQVFLNQPATSQVASLQSMLLAYGHTTIALAESGFSDLSVRGLQMVYDRDASAFMDMVQKNLRCSFADALALAAIISRN